MIGSRIGFACIWDKKPEMTWSHIPWHLRASMQRRANIRDVGVFLPPTARLALKASHARWRHGRPITTWRESRVTDAVLRPSINGASRRERCDAVLEIQDLAPLDTPFFLYQDMSYDALLRIDANGGAPFRTVTPATMLRRLDRQRKVYEHAAGVFAMSHWLARSLVDVTGLPHQKVHVVYPGISAATTQTEDLPLRDGRRHRLLFVGRDFHRKGGDLVVKALAILRREVDPSITLTVVGPDHWPLSGNVPDGVDFRGAQSLPDVAQLYDSHDLYVMPSRLEAFGIAFIEALARGLPCIGRDAYAMPEIIRPGVTGALAVNNEPREIAELVSKALVDDLLYTKCRELAQVTRVTFSWDRAGREIVDAIDRSLGR